MRWLAVHLPLLPLELHPRQEAGPRVLSEPRRGVLRVMLADAAASAQGIVPGMALNAARARCAGLQVVPRSLSAEQAQLRRLAIWAGRFTPGVVFDPPFDLILDVEHSLRLFGGSERLRARVRGGLEGLGHRPLLCQAPVASAARLLARAGREELLVDLPNQLQALRDLSLDQLEMSASQLGLLRDLGLHRFGELLRLPRDGLARRCGPALVTRIDQLTGRCVEYPPLFRPPDHFHRRLELDDPVSDHSQVLRWAGLLIDELVDFLRVRELGCSRLHWRWLLERDPGLVPDQHLELGLQQPTQDGARLERLLLEALERQPLQRPLLGLELTVKIFQSLSRRPSRTLFPELMNGDGQSSDADLIDRLSARLGSAALRRPLQALEHRPERTECSDSPHGPSPPNGKTGARPLWLLPQPLALRQLRGRPYLGEALRLEAERERVESGWWDNGSVRRDYFIARTRSGERLWVFNDSQGDWFLQGAFAEGDGPGLVVSGWFTRPQRGLACGLGSVKMRRSRSDE